MKKWANGLVGAIVGAVAAALPAMLTDPEHFSPVDPNAWKHLVPLLCASGLVGAALYLKQHPTPWDGVDRRNGGIWWGDISPMKLGRQTFNQQTKPEGN